MIQRSFFLITYAFISIALSQTSSASEPKTVSNLDLSKYQGTWFEIARFPNPFQKKCKKNVTATYRLLENGYIEVINSCVQMEGSTDSVKGLARQQKSDSSSKLEVSFFKVLGWRPIWGDYWVLYIDSDYQVAVVGDRKKKYGWILSKVPSMSKSQKETALSIFEKNGYSPKNLIYTLHD